MVSKISEGVTISVETFYQPDYSNPETNEYMFAYRITIENNNTFSVQLLRRHWYIFDSDCNHREVEGEGVIGIQPQIVPGVLLLPWLRQIARAEIIIGGRQGLLEVDIAHGRIRVRNVRLHRRPSDRVGKAR